MKNRKKRWIACGAVFAAICLAVGGTAGWYFGVYTKDFKVRKGEVFSEVYPGDFFMHLWRLTNI